MMSSTMLRTAVCKFPLQQRAASLRTSTRIARRALVTSAPRLNNVGLDSKQAQREATAAAKRNFGFRSLLGSWWLIFFLLSWENSCRIVDHTTWRG
jgi:hypothetical protein